MLGFYQYFSFIKWLNSFVTLKSGLKDKFDPVAFHFYLAHLDKIDWNVLLSIILCEKNDFWDEPKFDIDKFKSVVSLRFEDCSQNFLFQSKDSTEIPNFSWWGSFR